MKYFCEIPEVWALEFLEKMPFTGYWISSLTRSWQKGYSDNCTLPWTDYVEYVVRLRQFTERPIMVDVDMLYADIDIAPTVARAYEVAGADSIVVESKVFPKVNSLMDHVPVMDPDEYYSIIHKVTNKVSRLKVYARLEYLYMMKDPAKVASIGINCMEAGADGLVIHWKDPYDLEPLELTLRLLKNRGIPTGIIPTKFLNDVGKFNDITDFSILGNVVSSKIREQFEDVYWKKLITQESKFY